MESTKRLRIAVTGREGQLARAIAERAGTAGVEAVFLGRPELDLARPGDWTDLFSALRPGAIVNAAAHTRVDDAEDDPAAEAVNGEAPGALARIARGLAVPIVQVSTDYVFDGSGERAWREDDLPAPLNRYGRSKLAGERAVAAATPDHAILRTSWVYGPSGRNFVRTMLSAARQREQMTVVDDQVGSPTSALDLADGVIAVARALAARPGDAALRGVFHMAGGGSTSWAGFAEAIFEESAARGGPAARVVPIPSSQYPQRARRPANSRLDCARLAHAYGIALPPWRTSLGAVVARILDEG